MPFKQQSSMRFCAFSRHPAKGIFSFKQPIQLTFSIFFFLLFLSTINAQEKDFSNTAGQYKFTVNKSSLVADGKQSVELVIIGIKENDFSKARWNVPKKNLSTPFYVLDEMCILNYTPDLIEDNKKIVKLRLRYNNIRLQQNLTLWSPLTLKINPKQLEAGKGKAATITLSLSGDDLDPKGFELVPSTGKVETVVTGKKWKYNIEGIKKPISVWFSLQHREAPDLSFAQVSLDIISKSKVNAVVEEGSSLYVEMNGKRYGPLEGSEFTLLPGVETLTFIAIDAAGNETKVKKHVGLPPRLDLTMTCEVKALALGGLTTVIKVIPLGDPIEKEQLRVKAKYGSCSKLHSKGNGGFHFIYTSPKKGRPVVEEITISTVESEVNASATLELKLVPSLLSGAKMTPVQLSSSDGQTEVYYSLELSDSSNNAISNAEFNIDSTSENASVDEIVDLGGGKYSVRVIYDKDVKPENVDLNIRFGNSEFNPKTSTIMAFPSARPGSRDVIILVNDDQSRPLGDATIAIRENGGKTKFLKTNSLGAIHYQVHTDDNAILDIGFKGLPFSKHLTIPKSGTSSLLAEQLLTQTLTTDVFNTIKTQTEKTTIPIDIDLSQKNLENSTGPLDLKPDRLIIKAPATKLTGDGKSSLSFELLVLNKRGLPLPDKEIVFDASAGGLSTVSASGSGRYTVTFTAPLIEKETKIEIKGTVQEGQVRSSFLLTLTPPVRDDDVNSSTTTNETESNSTTTTSSTDDEASTETATSTDSTDEESSDEDRLTETTLIPTSLKLSISKSSILFPETVTIKAEVSDQNGEPLSGIPVEFSLSETTGSLNTTSGKTITGSATTVYTPEDADYTQTITASVDTLSQSVDLTVKAQPIPLIPTEMTFEADESEISYPNTLPLKVTITDQFGQPMDLVDVSFSISPAKGKFSSSSSKTSGGEASTTYTPIDESYSLTLSASAGSLQQDITIDVLEQEKPPLEITFDTSIPKDIRIGEEIYILVSIGDKNGQSVKDGYEINFNANGGTFNPSSVNTSGGKAGSTFSPGSSIGAATLSIAYENVEETESIEILAGPPDKNNFILSVNPTTIKADAASTAIVEVEVRDSYKNLVNGEKINFSLTGSVSPGSLNKDFDYTDSNGLASVIYTAGSDNDSIKLTADVASDPSVTSTITLNQQRVATWLSLEDSTDGSGSEITSLDLTAGESKTLHSISRDVLNNFVEHLSVSWTAGSVSSDISNSFLTPTNGGKSILLKNDLVGTATFSFSKGSLKSKTIQLNIQPDKAASFKLTGPNTSNAGTDNTVFISALDRFGNIDTNYQGIKNLIFSGALSIGNHKPSAQGNGSAVEFGLPTSVSFTSGVAQVKVKFVKTENVTLHIVEGSISSKPSQGLNVVVSNSKTLGSLDLYFIKISGKPGAHLVTTAYDVYGNIMINFDPGSDMTFKLKTGTQSIANLTWSDLESGITALGDGSAYLNASSFGTFDSQGRLLVGINNTKAETNTVEVKHGNISKVSNAFAWSPDAASFLVFGSNPQTTVDVGTALTGFTVKVIDQFGNVLTGDNGRNVVLTVTDGTSVFNNGTVQTVSGIATFSNASYPVAESVTFQATSSGLNPTPKKSLTVEGGVASKFSITSSVSSQTAGLDVSLTIKALNANSVLANTYSGTIQITSTDTQATLPANKTFSLTDKGQVNLTITPKTSGTQTFTVVDTSNSNIAGTFSLTVTASSATKLAFNTDLPSSAVSGSTLSSFTVSIQDAYSNVVVRSDTITLSLLSGTGSLSGTLSKSASSGIATFSDIAHNTVESIQLRASASGLTSADSSTISIASSGFHHFVIITPFTSLTVGQSSLVNTIKAVDANGTVVTSYTGTVHFTSTDTAATLPGDYTFTAFDQGETSFTNGITFNTVGSQTFSVADTTLASSLTKSSTFTISSSSKALFKTNTDQSPPEAEQLLIYPKSFIPNPDSSKDLVHVILKGLYDESGISHVTLSVKSGSQKVRSISKRPLNNELQFTWHGRNDQGKIVENGIYTLSLTLFDLAGNKTEMLGSVNVDSNFDFGSFGP